MPVFALLKGARIAIAAARAAGRLTGVLQRAPGLSAADVEKAQRLVQGMQRDLAGAERYARLMAAEGAKVSIKVEVQVRGLDEFIVRLQDLGQATRSLNGRRAIIGVSAAHARYVHDGTRPHPITPRTKRALYWRGSAHPVRSVRHPGYKGNPFLADALEISRPQIVRRFETAVVAVANGASPAVLDQALRASAFGVQAISQRRANVRYGTLRNSHTTVIR